MSQHVASRRRGGYFVAYSKRKPKKPGRRILSNGRSGTFYASPPYAAIPASMLASAAFKTLFPTAIRVLLLFYAAYNPDRELFISQNRAKKQLKASPNTISAAYAELEQKGFIIKLREHIRPGGMGSAGGGKAAVYGLPTKSPELESKWRQQSDPGRSGSWRIYSERLRSRLKILSPAAVKLWCHMHAVDRRSDGGVAVNVPRPIPAKEVGLPRETTRRAAAELRGAGIIRLVTEAAGSRPATYELTETECKGLKAQLPHLPQSPAIEVGR